MSKAIDNETSSMLHHRPTDPPRISRTREIKFIIAALLNGTTLAHLCALLRNPSVKIWLEEWRNRFNFSWRISLLNFLSLRRRRGRKKRKRKFSNFTHCHAPSLSHNNIVCFSIHTHFPLSFRRRSTDGKPKENGKFCYWFSQRDFPSPSHDISRAFTRTHTRWRWVDGWKTFSLVRNFRFAAVQNLAIN